MLNDASHQLEDVETRVFMQSEVRCRIVRRQNSKGSKQWHSGFDKCSKHMLVYTSFVSAVHCRVSR
eukprot:scaffold3716_cov69-Cylindrotheca_fusiformis.AAC.8